MVDNRKKYRLKKLYPGSPKLGTIVETNEHNFLVFIPNDDKFYGIYPEKHPEFWEEVVEKDYQILSFYAKNISGKGDDFVDPDYIWYETFKGNGKWSRKGHITTPYNTQEIINHNGYSIHSVKRLSDGEIFTVGDDINHSYKGANNETITKEYKIEKIYFIEENRLAFYVGNGLSLGIKSILKLKQPLFTTEDGVDIYQNSELWWVAVNEDTKTLSQNKKWEYNKFNWNGSPSDSKNYKWFSTKEKAEEYILYNKPMLSLNEVFQNIEFQYRKDLIKLAKSKL